MSAAADGAGECILVMKADMVLLLGFPSLDAKLEAVYCYLGETGFADAVKNSSRFLSAKFPLIHLIITEIYKKEGKPF